MIKSLSLTNFTCFGEYKFDFCKGINILIGKNGTGKTHILKALAAIYKSNDDFKNSSSKAKEKFESLLAENFISYFKPEQLGRLTRRMPGRSSTHVGLQTETGKLNFSFSTNSKSTVKIENLADIKPISTLYLPPREMLSSYEGFESLVENREVSFDATYLQLAKALKAPILKGSRYERIKQLITPLEEATEAKIIKENGRFYLKNDTGKMEAHLVAEGLRKIASVMYLITNGCLSANSILFWDEPESNLNPKLIHIICDLLLQLANNGVQIFIASHDYLLTHRLSLHSEYKKGVDGNVKVPSIKFFCLTKEDNDGNETNVLTGETLAALSHNPILEEYADFYDLEQSYFNHSIESV